MRAHRSLIAEPRSLSGSTGWEKGYDRVVAFAPYVTLAVGTVISLLHAGGGATRLVDFGISGAGPERIATLLLAGATALWTWATFTTAGPELRDRQWLARTYFVGLLALACILIAWDTIFFIYAITGFFHAYLLRPAPLAFLAVGATSVVINGPLALFGDDEGAWLVFGLIVGIQTLAIGFGIVGGEKISDLSEQRRHALADLEAAMDENAGLQAQIVAQARDAGVLDERQRMAREIHDTVAQGLTGVITQLEAVRQARHDPAEMQRHLDNATRLARESLAEARRSVEALRPGTLDGSRLSEAVTATAIRWSELSGVPVHVTTTGEARPVHPDIEVTLLRAAQEGLANVARHAAATRAGVTLSYMDDVVTLDVRDDGLGIVNGSAGGGFGLTAMRQRVEALDGTLQVESEPGRGTAVSVAIPLAAVSGDG